MSIDNTNLSQAICRIVEAMLPVQSDDNLGLMVNVCLETCDFGYGEDGNTKEREPQSHKKILNYLFIRSSNYTSVYLNEDKYVMLHQTDKKWRLECHHDSCWRDSGLDKIIDCCFELCKPICKARNCAPIDVLTFHRILGAPEYVKATIERVNPEADTYSDEGRMHTIKMERIGFHSLVQYKYMDKDYRGDTREFSTGLLIKGSKREQSFARIQKCTM